MNDDSLSVKVAVIAPVYNVEKYISEFLDSVLAQTYQNLEVITVNDGSKDNSLNILHKYQKIDSRVKVVNKTNGGASSARNAGLDAMSSDVKYVSFVDPDDKISEHYVESFVKALEKDDADYAVCSFSPFDRSGINNRELEVPPYTILSQDEIADQYWSLHKTAATSAFLNNKMFRVECIKGLRFDENLRNTEDHEFMTRALLGLKKGVMVPEINFFYRKRASSLTSVKSDSDWVMFKIYSSLDIDKYTPTAQKCIIRFCDTNRLVALRYFYSSNKFTQEWISKYIAEQRKIPLRCRTIKNIFRHKMLYLGYWVNKFYYSLSSKNKTRKINPNYFP